MTKRTGETPPTSTPGGLRFNIPELVSHSTYAKYKGSNEMTVPQINALREIPGVKFPPDSGAGYAGVYWFPTFMEPKKVQRSYARTGHLDGINRTNYDLIADSRVTRILLDDGTATGVIFKQTALNVTSNYTVKATREVILAAGAIHTPQILQLSGIGPKKLLDSAGIETVVDLPGVGQNFQDHPMLSSTITIICRGTTYLSASFQS